MRPRGPNEKIIAIAVVNGGDTSGSRTAASSAVSSDRLSRPRDAVNANRNPISVPPTPTPSPSSRLFRNALIWFRSVSTSAMPAVVKRPWSNSTRASSVASGKTTNSASSAHSAITVSVTAGSRRRAVALNRTKRPSCAARERRSPFSGVQYFGDPAIDDVLAIRPGIRRVDREDLHALENGGETRLERDVRVRGHEIDLVFR